MAKKRSLVLSLEQEAMLQDAWRESKIAAAEVGGLTVEEWRELKAKAAQYETLRRQVESRKGGRPPLSEAMVQQIRQDFAASREWARLSRSARLRRISRALRVSAGTVGKYVRDMP